MAKNSSVEPSDKWEIEDNLRTLQRAEEIKRDPKKMKQCRELAKQKMTEMACVVAEGED